MDNDLTPAEKTLLKAKILFDENKNNKIPRIRRADNPPSVSLSKEQIKIQRLIHKNEKLQKRSTAANNMVKILSYELFWSKMHNKSYILQKSHYQREAEVYKKMYQDLISQIDITKGNEK